MTNSEPHPVPSNSSSPIIRVVYRAGTGEVHLDWPVDRIAEAIQEYMDAGYSHVYVHQVGPEQEPLIDVLATELLPRFQ